MRNEEQSHTLCRTAPKVPPRHPTSGQSLLELAFLTPLLLLLLIGCIEVGRYAYYSIAVGNAAHAGAAYGSQNTTTAGNTVNINAAACYDFNGTSANCGITVSTQYVCQCDNNGTFYAAPNCQTSDCASTDVLVPYIEVTATGTFTPIFNFPGFQQSFTVTRKATMRIN